MFKQITAEAETLIFLRQKVASTGSAVPSGKVSVKYQALLTAGEMVQKIR